MPESLAERTLGSDLVPTLLDERNDARMEVGEEGIDKCSLKIPV